VSVRWVRVGDVAEQRVEPVRVEPTSVYRMLGLLNRGRGFFARGDMAGAETSYSVLHEVRTGDLVYSKLFGWEGSVALAAREHQGGFVSSEFPIFELDDTKVIPRYMAHIIMSEEFVAQMAESTTGMGQRRQRVNPDGFRKVRFPLPEPDDQRRIAARLDATARFREAVEAKVAARVRALAIAPRLTDEVLSRERLDPVPVRELFDVVSDVVHPGEDPAPAERFVGLEHIEPHTGRRLGQTSLRDFGGRKLRFSFGDVLYGYLRPYQNKVWRADGPGLCSVEQYVLRPRAGVDGRLLGHVLRAQSTLDRVNDATHRLQLPRIRTALLGAIEVPDIRQASADLGDRLERITDLVARLSSAQTRQAQALASLLPAARNEEFSRLTSA